MSQNPMEGIHSTSCCDNSKGPHTHPKSACFTGLHISIPFADFGPQANVLSAHAGVRCEELKPFKKYVLLP